MAASLGSNSHFRTRRHPRRQPGREHRLLDILVIAICAVIAGANSWRASALFGRTHRGWFQRFLALPNGMPSYHTCARLFQQLDPQAFQTCLRQWLRDVSGVLKVPHIAMAGKTLRGSGSAALGPLHLVSAWATQAPLSLGQVAVEAKSHELTAIPAVRELLELHGAVVTLDALSCQQAIAEKIVPTGGDEVVAVTDHQEHRLDAIQECVGQVLEQGVAGRDYQTDEKTERGHGRVETRSEGVIPNPEGIRHPEAWPKLRVVGRCPCERTVPGETSSEVRYVSGSKKAGARDYGRVRRDHWRIETNRHGQLESTFAEDRHTPVDRQAAATLAMRRRLALVLWKRHPDTDRLRNKRLRAGWDTAFLEEVLCTSGNSEKV